MEKIPLKKKLKKNYSGPIRFVMPTKKIFKANQYQRKPS
jgi:hypothetical protein